MRTVIVGDPHVTVEDLEDCHSLMNFVVEFTKSVKADTVTFLGDLHHNHALVNVRVMDFWKGWWRKLNDLGLRVISLVGNHDMPGDGSRYPHALVAYDGIAVIDQPIMLDGVAFMPYYADPNLFVRDAGSMRDASVLICHQEFSGAQFENGFYSPNGVNPDDIPQSSIISGHIHKPQKFGKVWYPGAPRWRTITDAEVTSRSIYYIDTLMGTYGSQAVNDQGRHTVCQIWSLVVRPGEEGLGPVNCLDRYHVRIEGPTDFVKEQERLVKSQIPNAKITLHRTDGVAIKVKESDGISVAFRKYLGSYRPKFGTLVDTLNKLANERIYAEEVIS